MNTKKTVYVVETDHAGREQREKLILAMGFRYRSFASVADYLESPNRSDPGCLLLVEGIGELDYTGLQDALQEKRSTIPTVILSTDVTVNKAVWYMQQGAFMVIDEPCDPEELGQAIESAVQEDATRLMREERYHTLDAFAQQLTDREWRVMDAVVAGRPNKAIARDMDLSVRTIEQVRAQVFRKFVVETPAQLATMATEYRILSEQFGSLPVAVGSPHFSKTARELPHRSLRLNKLLCV